MRKGWSFLSAGTLVVAVVIITGCDTDKKKIECASNLKQIGLAIKQYSIDYGDQYPDKKGVAGFEQLRSLSYLTDVKVFVCPCGKEIPAKEGEPLTEANVSYVYLGNGLSESSPVNSKLARDKDANHSGYGNILFSDGSVQGFHGANWKDGGK